MKNEVKYRSTFLLLLFIGFLFSLFIFSQGHAKITAKTNCSLDLNQVDNKQRGAHIFGRLDTTSLQKFRQNNLKWITLVPYSDQKDFDSPKLVYFRGDSLQNAQRDARWKNQIELAHSFGFKIFLKPHIWLSNPSDGKWRSDIFPTSEKNWQRWQKNYRDFILHYAKIAQQNKVELFCIGTELTRLSREKADFWKALTQEVRAIYTGKITYAANWYEEYEKISFWDDLDFIGIQAYFPLAKNNYPTVEQISTAWTNYFPPMETLYKKFNRKILFTEMGYKSTADSAIEPWQWIDYSSDQDSLLSMETQANCYTAFFNTVWKKPWFAGVHIWQMRSDFKKGRGKSHLDFTPQEKPAEMVIAKGFE